MMLSPATMEVDRRQAVLVCRDGWAQRTAPLLIEEPIRGHPGSGARTSFRSVKGAWCVFRPQSGRAHSVTPATPAMRGVTSFDELAFWLCPNPLNWPPGGPDSGSRRREARSTPV